jgi:hypothetical protein
MKDKLCLIPYSDIELDKTYTNISEYFLRGNCAVSAFLAASGADDRFICGDCSDFDLLRIFLKACNDENAYASAVAQAFDRVVMSLIGEISAFSIDADTLWMNTSEALTENKLRSMLATSGLEEIGVPVLPTESFDSHFSAVKGISLAPVACPLGIKNVSFNTFESAEELSDARDMILDSISAANSCAVFASDLSFEKPNEYTAAKAYEKYLAGQNLLNKEKAILASQLLRITALASSELDREMMIFLPTAPDVKAMGAISEFVDYIDGCDLKNKLKLSVFGGDAVGLCMAASIAGKRYKNITAVTGICGNGSDVSYVDVAKYWGYGVSSIENYASLAKTPALLLRG